MYHEAMHVILERHHAQDRLASEIRALAGRYTRQIKFSQEQFDDEFGHQLAMISQEARKGSNMDPGLVKAIARMVNKSFSKFLKFMVSMFHNYVADLGIIAVSIEMGDSTEYSYYTKFSQERLNIARAMVRQLAAAAVHIKNNRELYSLSDVPPDEMLKVIRMLIFVTLLNNYPLFIVPYARLGKVWEPGQKPRPDPKSVGILKEYEAFAGKLTSVPDIPKGLTKIFRAFDDMIDYHMVRNTLSDPLQKQLFDTGAINLSKKAFRVMMRETLRFYRKNKPSMVPALA
jgi:hypothetical protein